MRALGDVDVNFEPGTNQRTHIILNLYFNLKKYNTSFYKIGNYITLILSLKNDKKTRSPHVQSNIYLGGKDLNSLTLMERPMSVAMLQ
jgi:hypothetical protein